jgi:hypothetical protein
MYSTMTFDNIGAALLSLYRVTTLQWTGLLSLTFDAVGENLSLQKNQRWWPIILFVAFIFIVRFVLVNLVGHCLNVLTASADRRSNRPLQALQGDRIFDR